MVQSEALCCGLRNHPSHEAMFLSMGTDSGITVQLNTWAFLGSLGREVSTLKTKTNKPGRGGDEGRRERRTLAGS